MHTHRLIPLEISRDPDWPAIKRVTESTFEAINALADDLAAFGIDVQISADSYDDGTSSVFLVIEYDTEELKVMKGHRAGRRAKLIPYDSPLIDLTVAQAADWLDSHTVAEGMDAFGGVSRAVYYRRKKHLNQLRDKWSDQSIRWVSWQKDALLPD